MKHKTKKLLCSVLAFCQLFAMTAFARPDWPSDTGIQAEAGALMDVDSGTMIFGQNSHVEYPPASITKLLTALIVLEHGAFRYSDVFRDRHEQRGGGQRQ